MALSDLEIVSPLHSGEVRASEDVYFSDGQLGGVLQPSWPPLGFLPPPYALTCDYAWPS